MSTKDLLVNDGDDNEDIFDDEDEYDPSKPQDDTPQPQPQLLQQTNEEVTEEDRNFIDEHDDLQDITNTYKNQQEYSDHDSDDDEDDEFACDEKAGPAEFAKVAKRLYSKMMQLRDADLDCHARGLPALNKLHNLPIIRNVLMRQYMRSDLIEAHLVDAINAWIQPYDDGSLPNIDVRTSMYEILREYNLNITQLENSDIGKTILQLYRHYDETSANREFLRKLIDSWLKLIFKKNDNYRQMMNLKEGQRLDKDLEVNDNDDDEEEDNETELNQGRKIKKLPVFMKNVQSEISEKSKSKTVNTSRIQKLKRRKIE